MAEKREESTRPRKGKHARRTRQDEAETPAHDEKTDREHNATGRDIVEEASVESFPASDPPSFTPTRIGAPPDAREKED